MKNAESTSSEVSWDTAKFSVPRVIGCGFLMGAADVIPGVSGGTVALILGIYRRLISSISSLGPDFIPRLILGRWSALIFDRRYWFLGSVGLGIALGIVSLASLMRHLLVHHRSLTFAVFCGLIFASVLIVGRRIHEWTFPRLATVLIAAVVAFRIVTLPMLQNPPDGLWYLFLCGTVGISAMILPGISGAFILLILQRYFYVVDKLKELLHLNVSADVILPIAVFCAGCLTGLLSFSRVLNWLLARHEQTTISALCGFMIGATYCLWPFQRDTTPEVTDFKRKQFEHYLPDAFTSDVVLAIVLFLAALIGIVLLDHLGSVRKQPTES